MKTEAMNLKKNKEGNIGGFGGRKGKGEIMYNFKKYRMNKITSQ